MLWLQHPSL